MISPKTSYRSLILVSIIIFITRLPFIFNGVGGEEDAWGTYLVTLGIANSGIYEYSRLPGHPIQELIYALSSNYGFVAYNLLTVLISTTGIFFFMLSLRKLNFKHFLEIGLILAFIPIVYINSTNAMDYLWAMSFTLISFYCLVSRNFLFAGIMIGLAIGTRITAGAMLLPFIIFILHDQHRDNTFIAIIKLCASALLISFISFLPVMQNYGFAFFDYYKHFDHPDLVKILYKATLGIFGGIGILVFAYFSLVFLIRIIANKSTSPSESKTKKCILYTSAIVVLLYITAYFNLPFKSEFLIPIIPFVLMTMTMYLPKIQIRIFLIGMILSCFFGGVNLIHDLKGESQSSVSISNNFGPNKVAFDLLKGPLPAEKEKRKNQIRFVKRIISHEEKINAPTVIISGWWYNYIIALNSNSNHLANYVYYESQSVLIDLKSRGYEIFYLPEQDGWNNKRFHSNFTNELAKPLNP